MDMSIASTNKKDVHHSLLGSTSSLIAVIKTDPPITGKLKEGSQAYRERSVTSIRDML
jgi:hypothetical protein